MSLANLILKKASLKKINEYIKKYPNSLNEQDAFGYTPFMHAIIYERTKLFDIFLKHKSSVIGLNKINDSNQTVLILACIYKYNDLINKLLDKYNKYDFDLLRTDIDGNSALDYCIMNNLVDIIPRLENMISEYEDDLIYLLQNKDTYLKNINFIEIDNNNQENNNILQNGGYNDLETKIESLEKFIKSGRNTELSDSVMQDILKFNR